MRTCIFPSHPTGIHSLSLQFARLPRVREGIPTRFWLIPAHSAARLLPPGGPELGEPGAGPVRSPACTHRAGSLPSFSEQKQILEGSGSRCLGKVREETGKCVGRNRSAPAWAPAQFWGALDPSVPDPDPAQGTFHRLLRVFSPLPPRGAAVLRAEGWPAPLRSAQPYLLFRGVC